MVSGPTMFGIDLRATAPSTGSASSCAALAVLVTLNIRRSVLGRALVAMRDNDIAARTMGINLVRYKLLAFLTSVPHHRHRRRAVWACT
jgi:branched-chain amino acid transport system permease protein